MDFGSAGQLQVSISSRVDAMEKLELASQPTTMPYRPPELLEAGLQYTNYKFSKSNIRLSCGRYMEVGMYITCHNVRSISIRV
jgi:hypothetical protein